MRLAAIAFEPMKRARAAVAEGDLVAVVSPSGPSPESHIRAGAERLSRRYRVRIDPSAFAADGYLAGDDAQRARALLDALRDREVRAILCARGGYGATRLLERFEQEIAEALRDDPKPIVGFSDVTALHALWSREGVRSVHGPMVARLGVPDAVSELELDRLSCALEGRTPPMRASRFVVGSAFDGRAAGGNLAVLCALVATNVQPSFDGCVVFLEDVGERPYRVDRMLTQLRASGALRGARGFVLGDFHDCDPGPDGRTVEHVLRERLEDLGAPIVVGAPFGHGARCAAFELSVHAQVDERCEISFTAAPSREAVSGARGASRA